MEFEEWEPIYEAILADLGYDRSGDEAARDWLAEHVGSPDCGRLAVEGTVAVAGGAPRLEADANVASDADYVIAASDAATRLATLGIRPTLIVTDLDGDPEGTLSLAQDGVDVAVHAHGDNRAQLRRWLPEFPDERVAGTTQVEPRGPLVNVGGFTDGDRAAFLADALGAERLTFPGWDFADAAGEKRRKLAWAARLLHWLERRRGEEFPVLDGQREELDLSAFPAP